MLEVDGARPATRSASSPPRGLVLHELTPAAASLEDAFMELTARRGRVPHGAPASALVGAGRSMSTARWTASAPSSVTQPRVAALGVDQAVVAALDALDAARRGRHDDRLGVLIAGRPTQLGARCDAAGARAFDADDHAASALYFAQLAIGVLGVLVISGEYSTGMIRSSLIGGARGGCRCCGRSSRLRRGRRSC